MGSIPRFAVPLTLLAALAAVAAPPSPGTAAMPQRPLLVTVDDLPISSARLHPDAAERERITRDLLATLAKHRIRAVGFVTWRNVRDAADRRLLERWLDAGHELGHHSYGHPDYTRTEPEAYLADIEKGRAGLAAFLAEHGRVPRFFRYPMLREGNTPDKVARMRGYLAESGQRALPVTLDNLDVSFEAPWVLAARQDRGADLPGIAEDYQAALRIFVRHHERRGDELYARTTPQVLLLHATEVGAAQWDRLFSWLEATGHRFADADEVLADPAFSDPPSLAARYGFGLWDRVHHEREAADARSAVTGLLDRQAEAWSRGDLETFCSVYADDTLFVSPTGVTRGRREVLDRYRKRYPDPAAMGRLTLEVLDLRPSWGTEVSLLGDAVPGSVHAVSVTARWTLVHADRPKLEGFTLLVLERGADGWRIVRDASM